MAGMLSFILPQKLVKEQEADFDDIQTIITNSSNRQLLTPKPVKDTYTGRKSNRVGQNALPEADGDTWIEIIVCKSGKDSENQGGSESQTRSLFYSVNTQRAKWDEPPSGASKIIYKKDVDRMTNRKKSLSEHVPKRSSLPQHSEADNKLVPVQPQLPPKTGATENSRYRSESPFMKRRPTPTKAIRHTSNPKQRGGLLEVGIKETTTSRIRKTFRSMSPRLSRKATSDTEDCVNSNSSDSDNRIEANPKLRKLSNSLHGNLPPHPKCIRVPPSNDMEDQQVLDSGTVIHRDESVVVMKHPRRGSKIIKPIKNSDENRIPRPPHIANDNVRAEHTVILVTDETNAKRRTQPIGREEKSQWKEPEEISEDCQPEVKVCHTKCDSTTETTNLSTMRKLRLPIEPNRSNDNSPTRNGVQADLSNSRTIKRSNSINRRRLVRDKPEGRYDSDKEKAKIKEFHNFDDKLFSRDLETKRVATAGSFESLSITDEQVEVYLESIDIEIPRIDQKALRETKRISDFDGDKGADHETKSRQIGSAQRHQQQQGTRALQSQSISRSRNSSRPKQAVIDKNAGQPSPNNVFDAPIHIEAGRKGDEIECIPADQETIFRKARQRTEMEAPKKPSIVWLNEISQQSDKQKRLQELQRQREERMKRASLKT